LAAVAVIGLGLGLFFGLRGGDDDRGLVTDKTTDETVAKTTTTEEEGLLTTTTATTPGEAGTWLVMLYQDADDEILEEDMVFDLNEAELVGSTDRVTIVSQLDRYGGGYMGDGDWTGTRRYLVTKDSDLYTVNSEMVGDLGEVDMGDPQTLYDFVKWAITTYPAERYVLVLADHGAGWAGGWSDDDPTPLSGLTMQGIDEVLGSVVADTGIGAFELVGFDACLMGQFEVMSVIAPHARYAVGSEENEPALGWGYTGFLQALADNPDMTGFELGQAIVDSYIASDMRVIDDEARSLLTGGDYPVEDVVADLFRASTMSAVDLSKAQDLNAAMNELALALMDADQAQVAAARTYAQAFSSLFTDVEQSAFIDLGSFLDLLLESIADPAVTQAAQQVKTVLEQMVIAEVHGEERPGSTGLSFYFPISLEYSSTFSGWDPDYASSVGRFTTASLWDDFLTFHYTGEPFEADHADLTVVAPAQSTETDFTAAVAESAPSEGAEIIGPGAGELTIAPITVSDSEIGLEESAVFSTTVTGSNVAYVYYYVAYYWEDDGSYLSADMGYVEPGYYKEVNGVYYPDWGEEESFTVEYEWEPTLYFMSDGNEANDQFAFFEPMVYGSEAAGDVYTVRGTYVYSDTGTEIDAEMDFSGDGYMLSVWGYEPSGDGSGIGTWHEIIPRPGDVFNITEEYLEFDENPDGEFVDYYGGDMVFGDTPFQMVPYYAFPGDYVLGIGVEDLDGNIIWEFAELTVTE
jgi:hypothetical protein